MIYYNDCDALVAHDNEISGVFLEEDDTEIIEQCSSCYRDIFADEPVYKIRHITLCRYCYDNIIEV